jgi:hypothetical protein
MNLGAAEGFPGDVLGVAPLLAGASAATTGIAVDAKDSNAATAITGLLVKHMKFTLSERRL